MRFLGAFVSLVTSTTIAAGLILIERVLLAGILGPARFGAFGLALNAMTVLSRVLSLGLASATQYFASRGERPADTLQTCLAIAVVVGGASLGLAVAGVPLLGVVIFRGQEEGFSTFATMVWFQPVILLGMVGSMFVLGRARTRAYAVLQIAPELLFVLVLTGAWLTGAGLSAALAAQLLGWGSLAVFALIAAFPNWLGGSVDAAIARDVISYGLRSWPGVILSFGVVRVAVLTGARYVPPEALGHYVLAASLAEGLVLVQGILSQLVFNVISSRQPAAAQLALLVMRLSTWGLVGLVAVVATLGRPLFTLVFGSAFEPSWTILLVLLATTITRGLFRLQLGVLAGHGRPGVGNIAQGVELGSLLILIPFAATRFGVTGMAYAAVASSGAGLLTSTMTVRRMTGAPFVDMFGFRWADMARLRARLMEIALRLRKERSCG